MANTKPPVNPFPKGNKGKPKGTLNKKTVVKKQLIATVGDLANVMGDSGLTDLWHDIGRLKPKDRVAARLALMEFIYPKLSRMEVKQEKEKQIINIFGKQVDDADVISENNNTSTDMIKFDDAQIIE